MLAPMRTRTNWPLPRIAVIAALAAMTMASVRAQADRYELGLRLRAFERKLDATQDVARRKAAFEELDKAVQAFFGMNLNGVAEAVGKAEAALDGRERDGAERWAERLVLKLPQRLCDPTAGDASAQLESLRYGREDEPPQKPDGAILVASIDGEEVLRSRIGDLPMAISLPIRERKDGDTALTWRIESNDRVLISREQGLSIVQGRDARLAAFDALESTDSDRPGQPSLELQTVTALVRMLRGMTKARSEETVLPGARLLREAEAVAASLAGDAAGTFYDQTRSGQFWLRVPTARGSVHVRIAVPKAAADGKPLPLVFALHGAGGSENLFFDGYGDGAIVRLCEARNMLLCAPRTAGMSGADLPALLDALAARYPIDRARVLLIGHSMGAMQAVSQASASPSTFCAVAALGGGGNARKSAGLAKLPFFVAAGERDFGRAQAKRLSEQLQGICDDATYRDYPLVEHLAIVQVALPDVFSFFDRCSKESARAK